MKGDPVAGLLDPVRIDQQRATYADSDFSELPVELVTVDGGTDLRAADALRTLREAGIRGALEVARRRCGVLGQPADAALRNRRLSAFAASHEPGDHHR